MSLIDFDYAVVRFVPSARREEFQNIGVILHAPTASFLRARFRGDIAVWAPSDCADRLGRYVDSLTAVAHGDPAGGPLAALSASERFHWLTAPRSDMLRSSPCHPGRAEADALQAALDRIFEQEVAPDI